MPGDVMFFLFLKEQRVITSLNEEGVGENVFKGNSYRYMFFQSFRSLQESLHDMVLLVDYLECVVCRFVYIYI